jgi:hypothetical protein
MRISILAIAMIGGLVVGNASGQCPTPGAPQANISQIEAGEYKVVFVATNGRWEGEIASGTLVLRKTSPYDRSPRTGEKAQDHQIAPLFGWLDADLSSVGAPIMPDKVVASPQSRDPVYPGVLVLSIDWGKDYPPGTPVLTVSTLSNLRNGILWTDGAGIGLWVHSVTPEGFSGLWREWGIVVGGRGHFCATKTK